MLALEAVIIRMDRWLQAAFDGIVIMLAGLLLVLLNYAVFERFLLNASVSWGEEVPAQILAALTFVGAAYLTRTNEHLGFDAVVRLLGRTAQKVVLGFNLLVMAAFGGLLAYYGGIAAISFGNRMLISVDLPMALFRAALPVGGVLITLISAFRLAGLVLGRVRPEDLLPESDA